VLPRITQVEVVAAFRVALTFTDRSGGVADVGPWIAGRGGVFAALQDPAFFGRVRVDADAGTLVWPNGADLDPDMLSEAAHAMTAGELPRAVNMERVLCHSAIRLSICSAARSSCVRAPRCRIGLRIGGSRHCSGKRCANV